MAVRIRLEFFGDVQLDRTLARVSAAASDLTPAWEVLAERFGRLERRQFAGEGAFSGGWAPLSEDYREWKELHYPGKPILEREGDLKRSLTVRPFGVEVITPERIVVGSDVDYGEWHQHGTDRMPRRRPVEFPEAERREWAKVIQRFIITGNV